MAVTKITKNEIEAQEAWIAPALQNSWANFNGGWHTAGYMKDSMGFVHLKGLIKDGTLSAIAFTLPVGYRPAAFISFIARSNTGLGLVEITPAGEVKPLINSNAHYSLDGITFKAEQ